MNKSLLITAATIAIALTGAATSAIAVEATQFVPPTGTLTRAEVKADLARSQAGANVVQLGEATVFVDRPGTRSREEVRAEARAAIGNSRGDQTGS